MTDPWEVTCSEGGEPIDLRDSRSYWQKVEGYERKRSQGGQNHVALRRPVEEFICTPCMKKLLSGIGTGQLSLSANA